MSDNNNTPIIPIGHITIDAAREPGEPDWGALPIIATRGFVLFPEVTFPISLGRPQTLATARAAHERGVAVGIVCQRDPEVEHPRVATDLYSRGVAADILQVIELPDGSNTAIVRARGKFRILGAAESADFDLVAATAPVKESHARPADKEFFMLVEAIKESMLNIFNKAGGAVPEDMKFNIENTRQADTLINLIATHAPMDVEFKECLLMQNRIKERAFMLLTELSRNEQLAEINRDIQRRTKARIDENQRQAFLQQQMEAIREELYGDDGDEAAALRRRAEKTALTADARRVFDKEVGKLDRMNPQSPDFAVQQSYLDAILDLPWGITDRPAVDIEKAAETLDADHYGLERVKERMLEQIAVALNNPDGRSPIICLVGAPGVGKTSLGRSIAEAMGRKYQRVSLGGLHDESELRGHRRTYIGAMPGRIIEAMRRAGTMNPVLLLDEIDKLGRDYKGDPAAALLEVLDPEQNCRFHDNYVDVDFDLSKVLFITTANSLAPIPQPLLDRMEIIDIEGYLPEEKLEIARRHLLPRILADHNVEPSEIEVADSATLAIIERYTSESGVRQLQQQLAKIVRKTILHKMRKPAEEREEAPTTVITPESLHEYLGPERFTPDRYEGNDFAGVVTGLAWTQAGGEILYIESSLSPSKNPGLELTGNLGNVMKESAAIAVQWVKAHADELGIDRELFRNFTLNIHAPEGAIPKDGPSAGITIVTSIVSTFRQVKVRKGIAMTGEITLRGRVLPVGGIKEKILAAKRAGITDIILSSRNRRDVDDINKAYVDGLTFHFVDTVAEVVKLAITDDSAEQPLNLTLPTPAAKEEARKSE